MLSAKSVYCRISGGCHYSHTMLSSFSYVWALIEGCKRGTPEQIEGVDVDQASINMRGMRQEWPSANRRCSRNKNRGSRYNVRPDSAARPVSSFFSFFYNLLQIRQWAVRNGIRERRLQI